MLAAPAIHVGALLPENRPAAVRAPIDDAPYLSPADFVSATSSAPTVQAPEGQTMGDDFFSQFQDTLNRGVQSVVAVYQAKSAAELARAQVEYQRAALETQSQYERQLLAQQLTQPAGGISLPGTSSPSQASASSVSNSTLIIGLLALGAVLFLVR